jgi:DNA-binding IclR family transcriptional regulator
MQRYFPVKPSTSYVKSGFRALEIIRCLEQSVEPMRGLDISEILDIPKSSTTELLKTLTALGYLSYDSKTKRYAPSFRLVTIGRRISQRHFGGTQILDALQEIHERTNESASLFMQDDIYMRFVASVPGIGYDPVMHADGTRVEMLESSCGRAFLATLPDEEVIAIAKRALYRTQTVGCEKIIQKTMDAVRLVRLHGFAVCDADFHPPPFSSLSVSVLPRTGNALFVYGIGNHNPGVELELFQLMKSVMDKYLH